MGEVKFGPKHTQEQLREGVERAEYGMYGRKAADQNTFLDNLAAVDKAGNWEQMSLSTAQGAALLNSAYIDCDFDGRYVYLCTYNSNSFLRFDTHTKLFNTATSWEQCGSTTAYGVGNTAGDFFGLVFDGRYMYFAPYIANTFLRFDTTKVFNVGTSWEQMNMSTAQGASAVDSAYTGACFDGRYVYFTPSYSDTFLRFDTHDSFTAAASWETMSMSTATGAALIQGEFVGTCFDGRYVYYAPYDGATITRFDTQGTSFATTADWENCSLSTAAGAAVSSTDYFVGCAFDGRYVYFSPHDLDTFIRYDITQSFTAADSWDRMSMSTAQGGAELDSAYRGVTFDGRYMYFTPWASNTFLRYDTQAAFDDVASWSAIAGTTAGGDSADSAYHTLSGAYDGKYTYFAPFNADTILRVLATPAPGR